MKYELVIGMEIHAELKTRSKVFCGCPTTFGAPPNSQICPVCIGMPGVLPVLNRAALEFAIRTAIALHCRINEVTTFDRKNYYYPDLPKNYQISQNYQQLGVNGSFEIPTPTGKKRIGIINVHLEEDAGKLLHPDRSEAEIPTPREGARPARTGGEEYSLVDLNRSGMPLLEIVSAPDMRSTDEAASFMTTLKNLLQYLEVSDCKMQEGSLRFEINISLRPRGEERLGTKVEIKNLNSMKTALKAIEYEIQRQSQMLQEGERIVQETRLWDDRDLVTRAMRSKEFAQDYRYFPEPDLVEMHISSQWLEETQHNLPELQEAKKERFLRDYGIPEYDAHILTSSKALADYYEECLRLHNAPKSASNWIMTELLRELNDREIEAYDSPVTPRHLAALIRMIDDGTISGKIAKTVFAEMMQTCLAGRQAARMPEDIVKDKGLVQISDAQEIETIVEKIIAENQDAVEQVRKGKDRAIGFLVGQIMKATRGKANPQLVNELLKKKIQ